MMQGDNLKEYKVGRDFRPMCDLKKTLRVSLLHQLELLVSVNKKKHVYQITVFTIHISDIFI
jgi:hypothetical protein